MATNKTPKQLPLAPEVIPELTPEVIQPVGPEIVYIGEGADKVPLNINPKATKYVVHSDGLVLEYL